MLTQQWLAQAAFPSASVLWVDVNQSRPFPVPKHKLSANKEG